MKLDTWYLSRHGNEIDLARPTARMVDWAAIAESLSKLCRFNGHCIGFYSVAQHSVLVADLLPPELRIYGLLHDAHEAFIGDLVLPLKNLFRIAAIARNDPSIENIVKHAEKRIDKVIYSKANVPLPTIRISKQIKRADLSALAAERRDLIVGTSPRSWTVPKGVEAPEQEIVPMEWREACNLYLGELIDELRKRRVPV